jgi:hypothetical protein
LVDNVNKEISGFLPLRVLRLFAAGLLRVMRVDHTALVAMSAALSNLRNLRKSVDENLKRNTGWRRCG